MNNKYKLSKILYFLRLVFCKPANSEAKHASPVPIFKPGATIPKSESVNCYTQLDAPTLCRLSLYLAGGTGALGTVLGIPHKGSSLRGRVQGGGMEHKGSKENKVLGFSRRFEKHCSEALTVIHTTDMTNINALF